MEEYFPTPRMDDQDETEDTLSFCDLPIHSSDSADWENSSKENQILSSSSTSSSSSDQDLFEFFSEEWSKSSNYPVQNILFCGKLIPFKEQPATQNLESSKNPQKPRKQLGNKAAKSGGSKNGFSVVRKVLLLGSPAKWRWQLLACGMGVRFPAEMELNDIRSRQRRRSPPAALFLGGGAGGDKKVGGGGKGLWAMIRALCGRRHHWSGVPGQFGCLTKV